MLLLDSVEHLVMLRRITGTHHVDRKMKAILKVGLSLLMCEKVAQRTATDPFIRPMSELYSIFRLTLFGALSRIGSQSRD